MELSEREWKQAGTFLFPNLSIFIILLLFRFPQAKPHQVLLGSSFTASPILSFSLMLLFPTNILHPWPCLAQPLSHILQYLPTCRLMREESQGLGSGGGGRMGGVDVEDVSRKLTLSSLRREITARRANSGARSFRNVHQDQGICEANGSLPGPPPFPRLYTMTHHQLLALLSSLAAPSWLLLPRQHR